MLSDITRTDLQCYCDVRKGVARLKNKDTKREQEGAPGPERMYKTNRIVAFWV